MSIDKSQAIPHRDSRHSIMKSTSVLSLGTLSSRAIGFVRDVILARLLGTGMAADAFFVASRIPNLFRDMIGEGATNAALVPVFSEYLEEKDRVAFWNFVSVVVTAAMIILSLITALGIVFSPVLIRLTAPGFMADPGKLQLTIHLTQIMFPYLIFIALTAYSMGILFTFRSFFAPAFSPCLLNIAMIISAFLASRYMKQPVFGLAIGVLVGGVLQLVAQIPSMLKAGMTYRLPKSLSHPGLFKIGRLLIPRMIGNGIYQLAVLIDTFCASLANIIGPGGISAIYYANRLIQFPMGIFTFALSSAVLPSLSGFAVRKDYESLKKTLAFSLENIFFVMCPTTIIFMFLAHPIIRVFFQRGQFDAYSTDISANALCFYSLGLFSFGGIKILVTAFYAMQDTRTTVIVAGICLAINTVLNFILMYPLKVGGIALASSISGTIDFLVLFTILNKRLGGIDSGLLKYFLKVTLASLIIGGFIAFFWRILPWHHEFLKLILLMVGGLLMYELICLYLKIEQAEKLMQWTLKGMFMKK
ncbi:MAG: murein biosynthesis integral membrane protein MurJ [Candidatus Omnitrophica bacterium]|nr:murein biosynthesis integral membrane protein MurJ [Candidatus Omnitrophota bacterium]